MPTNSFYGSTYDKLTDNRHALSMQGSCGMPAHPPKGMRSCQAGACGHSGSTNLTSGRSSGCKRLTPVRPCMSACQVSSTPTPRGVTMPMPVTTTRLWGKAGGGPNGSAAPAAVCEAATWLLHIPLLVADHSEGWGCAEVTQGGLLLSVLLLMHLTRTGPAKLDADSHTL
jgi:hypothetical protein